VQDGLAHLGADALPLMGLSEPRATRGNATLGELRREDVLVADHAAADEHAEADRPVVG